MGRRNRRGRNKWNGSRRSSRKKNGRLKNGGRRMSSSRPLNLQKNGNVIWKHKGPDAYPHVRVAPFSMCFTLDALKEMMNTVGREHPETGAKGFSPMDRVGFDVVEFDARGSASASSTVYSPDTSWGEERRDFHLHSEYAREWSGDIHSHPGSEWGGRPSGQSGRALGDLGYVREVFATNESMQYFLLPIITHGQNQKNGQRVAYLHTWVIERGREDEPMIANVKVCRASDFPERIWNPEWEAALEELEAVDDVVALAGGAVKTFRPKTLTARALKEEFTKRLGDAVSPKFHQNGIMVVGLGAGSYMVEKLARMSPASISLCDPDIVEISNLARTSYECEDVGSAKVDAMVKRLHRINPSLTLKTCTKRIQELSDSELDDMFEGVGVVVAGTDNFEAQAFLNNECVRRGVPGMFIGIHDGGEGGRIRWVVEGGPCYRCIDAVRFEDVEGDSEALDLDGADGSILDCQIIDMIAAKICVGLLERGQKSAYGAYFDGIKDMSEAVVINSEDYEWGQDLMDLMFASEEANVQEALNEARVHFRAPATLWFPNERDEDCPVCGKIADSTTEGFPSSSSKGRKEEVSI